MIAPPGDEGAADRGDGAGDRALDKERFDRLVHWIERAGGHAASLELDWGEGGLRGARARSPIPAGGTALSVPRSCLVTREAARASTIGRRIDASGVTPESDHSYLAAFLLQEHYAPRSRYRPYLDLLPQSFANVPLFFSAAELSLLEGSFSLDWIRARRAALAAEYVRLRRAVPEIAAFDEHDFVWARVAAISRVFGVTIEGTSTESFVPVADLLNHQHPRETSWGYEEDAGAFHVTALRGFEAGERVHDSYGLKCNVRFFVNYGFALADNDENEARIVIGPPGRAPRTFHAPAKYEAAPTQRMFTFLRRACAGDEVPDEEANGAEHAEPPVSAANEEAALALLAAGCEEALARFPATLAEDDALLTRGGLATNARNAVVMRRGEKRVLAAFVELARTAIPLLRAPGARAREAAAHRETTGEPFANYLAEVVARLAG